MAEEGRIWLKLRKVMQYHLEYAQLAKDLYDEMVSVCPGLVAFNRSVNMLISSPTAIVYYQLDCP